MKREILKLIFLTFCVPFISGCHRDLISISPEIVPAESMPLKSDTTFFEENKCLLLTEKDEKGQSQVVVLNGNMEREDVISGYLPTVGIYDRLEPVILSRQGPDEYRVYGLYLLGEKRWFLPPQYASLSYNEETELYEAYTIQKHHAVLDRQGNEIWKEDDNRTIVYVKDTVWIIRRDTAQADIYSPSQELLNEVNLDGFGDYEYGFSIGEYFVAYYEGNEIVFDSMGELIFQEKDICEALSEWFPNYDGDMEPLHIIAYFGRNWVELSYGGELLIYGLAEGRPLTRPGDIVAVYSAGGGYYTVTDHRTTRVYDQDGKQLLSRDGIPYSFVLGDGCYSYLSGCYLVVEYPENGRQYRLKIKSPGDCYISELQDGIFYMIDKRGSETEVSIYSGEACLIRQPFIIYGYSNGYLLLNNGGNMEPIVINSSGEIVYNPPCEERVKFAEDRLFVVERHNQQLVVDWKARKTIYPAP